MADQALPILASPFRCSELPSLHRKRTAECSENSDNESNGCKAGTTKFGTSKDWVFQSPLSAASPSLSRIYQPSSANGREESRIEAFCPPMDGLHFSPTLSESHYSFLSQPADHRSDGLQPICCPPDATDHLLEFVLRLTDTPPDPHFVNSDRPRCMTEDITNRSSLASVILDDLPFPLGHEPSTIDHFCNIPQSGDATSLSTQFDVPLFGRASDSTDGTRNVNLFITASSSTGFPPLDATCRSTLSLTSNNGSLTTSASTPSGTPTWSQELITGAPKSNLTLLQDSTLNRLLCSPLSTESDTPKGTTEERLSEDDGPTEGAASNYFHTGLLRLVEYPFGDADVHLPPTRQPNKSSSDLSSSRNPESGPFQSKSQLRHLHSNCFIQTAAEDEGGYGRGQGGGAFSASNYRNPNDGTWDENRDRRGTPNNNNNNGGISKGLTDFYSLAYASKRWQNLNVVLPIFIPHGVIAVIRSTGENTYVFPDQYPSSQLLFSGSGKICDLWSTYLRLRVAVIHKCPEFLVPRVAQVFNHVLATLPKFPEPIHLRCAGVVKHTIQLRSSGGLTYRYDTIGQISNAQDQDKMRVLFDGLQQVMNEVNHYLAREVENVFKSLQGKGDMEELSRSGNPKCGLEFRFSPCKELKIAIREGTVCDCAGVDSVIAGGGASSMSSWAQQFIVENLIVGELRLERDKTSETQLDPFFLPQAEVKTRMISKDLDGHPARICFVDPSVYPGYYRPRVEYAIGLTPLQAAEQLVDATHSQLSNLLPNGMNSLTSSSPNLHIPGVSLPQVFNSSSSINTYGDRLNGNFVRQPFGLTVSSSFSPTPTGSVETATWPTSGPEQQGHDTFPYPSWTLGSRSDSSNRETPVVGDAANDALKGLAVLQKMLCHLNLSEPRGSSHILDRSPTGLTPSCGEAQQFSQVINQATAAALALKRQSESLPTTPEACVLLSQLQSAIRKIPFMTPDTGSPVFVPSPRETSRDAPHLPFPSVGGLVDIESVEHLGQTNESESTTPHLTDDELRLLRGSKSLGATPVNYAAFGLSPTVSSAFIQAGGKDISLQPTPSTTMEASESQAAPLVKNEFDIQKDDNDPTTSLSTSRENI